MLASSPLLWTVGVWIALHLGADHPPRAGRAWREWLRLPLVWAFVLGLAINLSGIEAQPLVRALRVIGQATVPLMLFVLGLSIPWRQLRPGGVTLGVVAVKLFVTPLLAWEFAHALAASLAPSRAAILESAMPTMLFSIVIADRFALDVRAAALVIGWSTLAFWFSLPLWLTLIG
jgi:hypothetical protein